MGHNRRQNLFRANVRFGSKADMCGAIGHVCYGQRTSLFDHLVGTSEEGNGYLYPDCFSGFKIYHHLKFCRLLDWQVRWTGTLEDTIHVACGTLKQIHFVWAIRNKPTIGSKITEIVDRWQTVLCG